MGLDQPIIDDETNFVQSIGDPGPYYTIKPFNIHPHPPLGGWGYLLFGRLFGQEVEVYRLVPLLFWVINLILIYSIVKWKYSSRAALFSTLIFGGSYYSSLISLQIGIEASFLMNSFLFMTLFYLKYIESKKKVYLFLLGIFLGVGLWIKISAIFFLPIIFLHRFIDLKQNGRSLFYTIKRTIFEGSMVTALGVLIFSIFFIVMPEFFFKMWGTTSKYYGLNISWMALSMLLFWATPLLLGLFLFQASKFKEEDYFWTIWFSIIFVIYTFLILGRPGTYGAIGGVADYSRHFMNLMVPFSILGGVFLSRIKVNWKQLVSGIIIGLVFLASFFIINLNTIRTLPRDFGIYLSALKSFNFNFLFSFTTSSGNLLGINMGIIIFSIFLSSLLIIFYFILRYFKRFNLSKWILVLFIAVGVALNLFLVAEYLGPITSPDVKSVFYDLVDYAKENEIKHSLYVNDEGLLLHINNFKFERGKNQFYLGKYFEGLKKHPELKGTLLLLDWPPTSQDNPIWDVLDSCILTEQFYSRNILVGKIYVC